MIMEKTAVLSVTGDNALTIGLMGATLYVGALILAQLYMRVTGATSKQSSSQSSSQAAS